MSMFAQYLAQAKKPAAETAVEDLENNINTEGDAIENLNNEDTDQTGETGQEDLSSKSDEESEDETDKKDDDDTDPLDMNQIDATLNQADIDLKKDPEQDDMEQPDDVDYDGDGDISAELDQFDAEMSATEAYFEVVGESMAAIAEHGLHPSTFAVLKATKLLSTTALESLGLESFEVSGPEDDQTKLALEAMEADAGEKKKGMIAKILGFVKNMGEKLMNTLGALWEKIKGGVKSIKETAKAHPYATVATAVAAVAAVAGVVAYASGNLPGMTTKPEVFASFNKHMETLINKIKWPFGKIKASIEGGRLKTVIEKSGSMAQGVKSSATSALGWTTQKATALSSTLGRAWSTIKNAIGALGTRIGKIFEATKSFTAGAVGTIVKEAGRNAYDFPKTSGAKGLGQALGHGIVYGSIISGVSLMISRVVVGTFRLVAGTFSAISGGSKAEA